MRYPLRVNFFILMWLKRFWFSAVANIQEQEKRYTKKKTVKRVL